MLKGTDYLMLELTLYAVVAVYAIYRHRILVREVEATAKAAQQQSGQPAAAAEITTPTSAGGAE